MENTKRKQRSVRRKKRKFAGNQFVGSLKKVQTEVIKVDQENDEEVDGPINNNTQQETPKGIPVRLKGS